MATRQAGPMAMQTVERRFEVPVPPAEVHALLRDPRRLPELHPLIDSVVVTSDVLVDGEACVRFDIAEHVPMLGLSIANRYGGRRAGGAARSIGSWSRASARRG